MRHLVTVKALTPHDVEELFQSADAFREHLTPGGLAGEAVLLFYEPSTRTRISFEIAARRLGLVPIPVDPERASVQKGEGPEETLRTLAAMGVRALVLRTAEEGVPAALAALDLIPVVNAGDGKNEHPTQALLDLYTLRRVFGPNLTGLRLAIVGDVVHSRVAQSDVPLLLAHGVEVRLVGPEELVPETLAQAYGVPLYRELDAGIADADVVMALRIQRERERADRLPSPEAYHRSFGLTRERLGPRYLMHPGPANLGVEVAADVVDAERSLIRQQVANGVLVRMAVLEFVTGEARVYRWPASC
jgi:aspartate carbamoyltransferase catalytic subunit